MEESVSKHGEYTCPYLDQCDLIQQNTTRIPELMSRLRRNFCTNETNRCERRDLYAQHNRTAVPPLMLPDQYDWARQIIEETLQDTTLPSSSK